MRAFIWLLEYTLLMSDLNAKTARLWRAAGWIVALIAIFVVAGPQILALFNG